PHRTIHPQHALQTVAGQQHGMGAGAMFRTLVLFAALATPAVTNGATCEDLFNLRLPQTTITIAQTVGAGGFVAPLQARGRANNPFADLPAFCRVAATLTPSSDSDIKIEIWLPGSGWNGKLEAVGNGGWAGNI